MGHEQSPKRRGERVCYRNNIFKNNNEEFSISDQRHQLIESSSSSNTKQDKYKENNIQAYQSQVAEN